MTKNLLNPSRRICILFKKESCKSVVWFSSCKRIFPHFMCDMNFGFEAVAMAENGREQHMCINGQEDKQRRMSFININCIHNKP